MSALSGKSTKELLSSVSRFIPPLLENFHKGQAGRIVVIGGCEDYTGAPFFAAISATKLGADMSHIICEKYAATVIKSYNPSLMVHPYIYESANVPTETPEDAFLESNILPKVYGILDRVHVVVIGPGMGRDPLMLKTAKRIIQEVKKRGLPIVIDADGLFLINQEPDLIKGYTKAILTPNIVEFKRLQKALGIDPSKSGNNKNPEQASINIAKALGGVTVVQKGFKDYISNGTITLVGDIKGGLKRVGGQGDFLSGTMATFLAWALGYQDNLWDHSQEDEKSGGPLSDSDLFLLAAFGASSVTRSSSRYAFEKHGRAMLANDLEYFIGKVYEDLFVTGNYELKTIASL